MSLEVTYKLHVFEIIHTKTIISVFFKDLTPSNLGRLSYSKNITNLIFTKYNFPIDGQ